MGVFRQIQTSFWGDTFVFDLTAEETYGYMYLLTNDKTTQCGIYQLSKKRMSTELKYNEDTVDKILKTLQDQGKISYCEETKEIMILNWIKYNFINSKNTMMCMNKELKIVKNQSFIRKIYEICVNMNYEIDTIFEEITIPEKEEEIVIFNSYAENYNENYSEIYSENYDENITLEGAYKPLGEEEKINKEIKEKQKTNNKQKLINNNNKSKTVKNPKEALAYYENISEDRVVLEFSKNIRQATINDIEKINSLRQDFPDQVIIKAIKEGKKRKAQHPKYIWTILNNWKSKGLFTMDKFNQNKTSNNKPNQSTQTTYNRSNAGAYRYVD